MQMNMQMDMGADQQPVAAAAEEFDLETALEAAEFYLNPVGTGGGTFSSQALTGTETGLLKCTGNGTITKSVDALGTGKHGIILSGANNGHNILNWRNAGDTADKVGGDCMAQDAFWGVFTVNPASIGTNSANHYDNDRIFGTYTSTMGLVLRSTPIVQAGGFPGSHVTIAGPTVTVGAVNIIVVRKDATTAYVSVNGGAESSGAMGNLADMLTDAVCMGNSAADTVGAAITLGKCAMFKTPPSAGDQEDIVAGLMDYYGL